MTTRKSSAKPPEKTSDPTPEWDLRLYVAGQTPRSMAAIHNLRKICHEHLLGKFRMSVIDVLANPQLSREDQIVAIPTLVRKRPAPTRKIIGDFSNTARTLAGLELRSPPGIVKGPNDGTEPM